MPFVALKPMRARHFLPLTLFLVPTIAGSVCLWPSSAAEPLAVGGFALMLLSVVVTYISGIRLVMHDYGQRQSARPKLHPDSPTRL